MKNELTVSEIMKVPSSTAWKVDQINMILASKDAAMAVIEAESAAMADALKRIAEAMGLGIGHTAEEIVAAVVALQPIKASPAQGEWIEWNGGVCPIASDVRHLVKMRDGGQSAPNTNAFEWRWFHDGSDSDIVAYKVRS